MTEAILSVENIVGFIIIIIAMVLLAAWIAPKREKIKKIKTEKQLFETIDANVLRCKKCDIVISVHNKTYHIKKNHKEFLN